MKWKSSVVLAFTLAATVARAQTPAPCTTFDNNQLNGWTAQNSAGVVAGTSPALYAQLTDTEGPSNFVSPSSYHGNWLTFAGSCKQLCFDVNILNDGLTTSTPVSVYFTIGGSGYGATFRHTPVVENSGWRHFCAPIEPLVNGSLPTNGQGDWSLHSGTLDSNWLQLLSSVSSFKFAVDFAGAASQTERFQIDNICFPGNDCPKADFNVVSVCAGQQATFTNTSTGAVSSSWSFPGGTPGTSGATSPTVTYPVAGSHAATLCINSPPLCTTKNVTVKPVPPTPTITGPTTTCQKPSTYCVTPQPGVAYTWSVVPPTAGLPTPAGGTCTSVNWTSPAGGTVVVTATNKQGCSSTARLRVDPCDTHNPCCSEPSFKVVSWSMPLVGSSYVFRPVITAPPITRVVLDLISANISFSPPSCGSSHAFAPTITNVGAPITAPGLMPSQPVPNSTEAIWWRTPPGGSLTNVTLPVTVTLPPHSTACSDTIRFCAKYTVTDPKCRACERIECYELKRPKGLEPVTEDSKR